MQLQVTDLTNSNNISTLAGHTSEITTLAG